MADKKQLKYAAEQIDALLDKVNDFETNVKVVVDKAYVESLIDNGDNDTY